MSRNEGSFPIDISVRKGVEYLNVNHPGWIWKIDLPFLDLASHRWCVLSQLFEMDYSTAHRLLPPDMNMHEYGFNAYYTNRGKLTYPWKRAITELRAYDLWEEAGRPQGRDVEFWHQAER